MKINKIKPQAVLSLKLLIGTDGKEKMSMSLDNWIGIIEDPNEMYGKIMSIPDSLITHYFELCTYTPLEDIEIFKKDLEEKKVNPRDLKMQLAREIVTIYHGEEKAKEAENEFVNVFQKKEVPEEMKEIKVTTGSKLIDILTKEKLVESKSKFRRLIKEGAVSNLKTNEKITDVEMKLEEDLILKIGKHRFVKIKISP